MARTELITRDFIVRGMADGKTTEQMARELGVNPTSIRNKKMEFGLSRKRLDHKWARPWRVHQRDKDKAPNRHLMNLSTAIQSKSYEGDEFRRAVDWAIDIFSREMDISYSTDLGWHEIEADPKDWHIKKVLEAAEKGELPSSD